MNLTETINEEIAHKLEARLIEGYGGNLLKRVAEKKEEIEQVDPKHRRLFFEKNASILAPSVRIQSPRDEERTPSISIWAEYLRMVGEFEGNYYPMVKEMTLPLFHFRVDRPADPDVDFELLTRHGVVKDKMLSPVLKDRKVYTFTRRYHISQSRQGVVVDLVRIHEPTMYEPVNHLERSPVRLIDGVDSVPKSSRMHLGDQEYVQCWLNSTRNWPVSRI